MNPAAAASASTAGALAKLAAAKPAAAVPEHLLAAAQPGPVDEPKRLRALADLAELRMRARHWHLTDTGFAPLAGPVRTAYRRAAAGDARGARALQSQLRWLERLWPEGLLPARRVAAAIAHDGALAGGLAPLHAALAARDADEVLRDRLAERLDQLQTSVRQHAALLSAETPAAFARRLAGYWALWREAPGTRP